MAVAYNKVLADSDIRIGNRVLKKGETVIELVDSVEDAPPAASAAPADVTAPAAAPRPQPMSEAELRQIITEATERIARELVPAIADRVIREEIEKLKNS